MEDDRTAQLCYADTAMIEPGHMHDGASLPVTGILPLVERLSKDLNQNLLVEPEVCTAA